jgi:hypothetical protein
MNDSVLFVVIIGGLLGLGAFIAQPNRFPSFIIITGSLIFTATSFILLKYMYEAPVENRSSLGLDVIMIFILFFSLLFSSSFGWLMTKGLKFLVGKVQKRQ